MPLIDSRTTGRAILNDPRAAPMADPSTFPAWKQFANGSAQVPGDGSTDTVPSYLTPGEAVLTPGAAQHVGASEDRGAQRHASARAVDFHAPGRLGAGDDGDAGRCARHQGRASQHQASSCENGGGPIDMIDLSYLRNVYCTSQKQGRHFTSIGVASEDSPCSISMASARLADSHSIGARACPGNTGRSPMATIR